MKSRGPLGHLLIGGFLFLALVILGTLGYHLLEGWNLSDSLYMTIIAMTTTGFQEVRPLGASGRVLTIVLIVFGLTVIAYVGGRAVQVLVESSLFRRRRMEKLVKRLKDHIIVCGFGRMGRHLCADLKSEGVDFVVIDRNPEMQGLLEESGHPFILGDSSSDPVLCQAGIQKARGLISVVATDAENVFTALTARALNPDISIVSRALRDETEAKLRAAGATRVIKPYELVGRRLSQLVLRPSIVEFMDTVFKTNDRAISMEEVTILPGARLLGMSLAESPLRRDLNIIVVALRRQEGDFHYNPAPSLRFEPGDRLIVIGEKERIPELSRLCSPSGAN